MKTPDSYHRPDGTALKQQARLIDCTWEGAPVVELTGQVAELFPHVPVFSRHPFRVGGEENRFRAEPSCGVAESVIPVYCPLCSSRIVATVRRSW